MTPKEQKDCNNYQKLYMHKKRAKAANKVGDTDVPGPAGDLSLQGPGGEPVLQADIGSRASQEEADLEEPHESEDEVENEELEAHYDTVDENFSFNDYVVKFAQPTVVKAYTLLLGNFQRNAALTNHAIVKMLHRIGFDMNLIGLLFQARLFRVFQTVLNDPATRTSHFKEVVSFVHHVIRKFVEVAQNNNKVFVELFFYKNVKEAFEVVEGYGATRDSVKGKVSWTEEQEEELRYLFERFKDNEEDGKDTVDMIMEQITDESKTRRQIILALVHLGLLGSAKDLKRKHGPSKPRGWQEQEEVELRTLFEEHKESIDPVGDIMEAMTSKKSKPAIKKKLLEMCLVSDMKDLRKKRSGKSGGKKKSKNPWGSEAVVDDNLPSFSSESESENDRSKKDKNSSDEESEAAMTSDSGSDEEDNETPMYVKEIKKAAKKVLANGKQEAIKWIQGCLISVAEDREEEDDDEAIPVVPLTEMQEDAVEDKEFKQLLKRLGVKQPANEQERFWRVPGYLKGPDLRSRAAALDLSKTDTGGGAKRKSDDGRLSALKALAKQKKDAKKAKDSGITGGKRRSKFRAEVSLDVSTPEPSSSTQSSVQESGPSQESQKSPVRKSASKKRVRVSFDSDSDSGDEKLVIAEESSRDSLPLSKRPRVVDDSDSEDDTPLSGLTSSTSQSARKIESSDDEDEPVAKASKNEDSSESEVEESAKKTTESFPATAFSMEPGSDSDSDLDDHVPLKRGLKKAAIIESDED